MGSLIGILMAFSLVLTCAAEEAEEVVRPEAVVESLLAAMSENDGEKIRKLFSEDASQAYGDGVPKSGEAFFRWLDSDIIERKGLVKNPTVKAAENGIVVTGLYVSRGYSSDADFLFTVKDGKILSWKMRY